MTPFVADVHAAMARLLRETATPQAREALEEMGFETTLDYLLHCAKAVYEETGLLPHANPGTMTPAELERMRAVMVLYYTEGKRMREIGEHLGLTESRVSQIHSNAVQRLRLALRQATGEE